MKRLLWNITLSMITCTLLFALLFDLESCRKADGVLPNAPAAEQQQNPSVNLKDAKQWLNRRIADVNGRVDVPSGVWHEPFWSGNSTYEFDNGFQILRVDMTGDGLEPWGYREMIFFKDTTGQVDAVIMEVLGFVDYMERKEKEKGPDKTPKEYIDSDDFSGDIYIYDLGHNFLKGRRYKRNELLNEFIPVATDDTNGRRMPAAPPCEECNMQNDVHSPSGGGWGTPIYLPPFDVTAPALNNSFPSWSTGVSYRPLVPSQLPSWNNNSDYDMPIGGGGGSSSRPAVKDSYKTICPTNFSFVNATNNNLWQEAAVSHIECKMVVYNPYTKGYETRMIYILQLYFGLPYCNVNGKLLYTKLEAQALATKAFNDAEYAMREKFRENPLLTKAELEEYWISQTNLRLKALTSNQGRVGRTGSMNSKTPVPINPYKPC